MQMVDALIHGHGHARAQARRHAGMQPSWSKIAAVIGSAGLALAGAIGTAPAAAGSELSAGEHGWSQIVGSAGSTCGIRADASLWCWGSDYFGELGIGGGGEIRTTPVRVGTSTGWTTVSGYDSSSCGVLNGGLYCWGSNGEGQLGDGTVNTQNRPERIGSAADWASVDMGKQHACGTRTDGTLWCWGSNYRGALGDGTTLDHHTPEQVGTGTDWSSITSGWFFSCATRTDGTLWCWGADDIGQLGDGGGLDKTSPVEVAGGATDWSAVTAGVFHACGLHTDGSLWCWGANKQGQLGVGKQTFTSGVPVPVDPHVDWSTVSTYYEHTCATRPDGTAWCWGRNVLGDLGDGVGQRRFRPQQVGAATQWKSIDAAAAFSCGTYRNGDGWCWGADNLSQLGVGNAPFMPHPALVRMG
jgi:alpha-tubulin suppressor-like RCC1 family protein